MFASDEKEPNSFEATSFDLLRIEDLEVGQRLDSETGTFSVIKYVDEWLLLERSGKTISFKKMSLLKAYLIG